MPTRFLHDCRRTAARNLIRASVPERVAMLLTGHKTRAIFDRYNIINEQELLEAGDQLVAYLAQHAQATPRGRAHPASPRPCAPQLASRLIVTGWSAIVAHAATGRAGCPSVSSRGAHVGLRPRPHPAHAVSDGSFALFLLKPMQESRVDDFGPIHAEIGRYRIKAAEPMSAHGNPHSDRVWMSWHVSALADVPHDTPEVVVPSTDVLGSRMRVFSAGESQNSSGRRGGGTPLCR